MLPLEVVGNVPAGRPALEAAVARGLTMFAGTTVEATQASARLTAAGAQVPCQDAACWTAAGKAVGARHLVAGRVERKGANFEVQFRLLEGATGRLLATETNKCEAADCSVAELTRQTVRELARQMLSGTVPGVSSPGTAALTAADAAARVDRQRRGAASCLRNRRRRRWSELGRGPGQRTVDRRRLLPYAAIAAGVGALAVGGWLHLARRQLRRRQAGHRQRLQHLPGDHVGGGGGHRRGRGAAGHRAWSSPSPTTRTPATARWC